MFVYHLKLASLSIRRNPVISLLTVAAIATGIGACMTMVNIYWMASKNPIPHKSDQLYHVQLDSTPIEDEYEPGGEPPRDQISWRDALELNRLGGALRQTGMYKASFALQPDDREVPPYLALARMTGRDFFEMFEVDFLAGQPWPEAVDANPEQVVVITEATADKVYGDEDPVGQMLTLDGREYRVLGVVEDFEPRPKFYDLTNGNFNSGEELFLPMSLGPSLEITTVGNTNCSGDSGDTFEEFLQSSCTWITYWVELDSAAARERYENLLLGFAQARHEAGMYEREPNYRLRSVAEWLKFNEVADDDMRVLLWLSGLFLLVCLLNTIGLIMAKFQSRTAQLALRRAVGASRGMLIRQNLVEVAMLGVAGGLGGILLAMLGLRGLRGFLRENTAEAILRMEPEMMMLAVGIAVLAALAAGVYPAWRVGQIAPASLLKTQ